MLRKIIYLLASTYAISFGLLYWGLSGWSARSSLEMVAVFLMLPALLLHPVFHEQMFTKKWALIGIALLESSYLLVVIAALSSKETEIGALLNRPNLYFLFGVILGMLLLGDLLIGAFSKRRL